MFIIRIVGHDVAEQRVTGLELLGCVAGEKTETETRINLAASIHEWRRILFRSKNPEQLGMHGLHGEWRSVCVG